MKGRPLAGSANQIDRTVVRTDVLSWRATYIRENSNLVASTALGAASPGNHHLNTFLTNAEYHFGNKYSGCVFQ